MIPWSPLGEAFLSIVTVGAAFFLLAWLVARERLSSAVRWVGWLSVAFAVAAFFWSVWAESLAPYLRAGRDAAALRAALQVLGALVGVGLAVMGGARFLRAWLQMGWLTDHTFLARSAPFREIRQGQTAAERWRLAAALMGRVLRLPGLGWLLVGLGLTVLDLQLLEPEPSIAPDRFLLVVGGVAVMVGLGLVLLSRGRKG